MEIKQMLEEALRKGEFIEFLRGENGYMVEYSEFVPNAYGTDTGYIISRGIYKEYQENKEIKRIFEQGLLEMLSMTDFDVYKVCDYLFNQFFKEDNGLAAFKIEARHILVKLRQEIQTRKERIQRNGFVTTNKRNIKYAWDLFERLKFVFKRDYNIELF